MVRLLVIIFTLSIISCTEKPVLGIVITNNSDTDRTNEIVDFSEINILATVGNKDFIIIDKDGKQIPYQRTCDRRIIFPVTIMAGEESTFYIKIGTPEQYSDDWSKCGFENVDDPLTVTVNFNIK
jgi:hypothetical protein